MKKPYQEKPKQEPSAQLVGYTEIVLLRTNHTEFEHQLYNHTISTTRIFFFLHMVKNIFITDKFIVF